MDFVGRFQMMSVYPTKAAVNPLGEDGKPDQSRYVMAPSVGVTFQAVKLGDETNSIFGHYTPSGEIKMTIANPAVAGYLEQLWHDYLHLDEGETQGYTYGSAKQPKFEVTFRLLES